MIRKSLLIFVAVLLSMPALAQDSGLSLTGDNGDAQRRWFDVTITPRGVEKNGAYVSGQIVVDIRFLSSDPFKRLRLKLPPVEGARVETLVRPRTLQINMMGGRGYSHEARYAIFPQNDGLLVLPEISIEGIVQSKSGRNFEFDETFAERSIRVHPSDSAFDPAEWVVSEDVALEEHWSEDINHLSFGDTVRRTVTLAVKGVRAEDLPDLTLSDGQGYRVLTTERSVETQKTPNGLDAFVTQSWDVFIDTPKVFYIDPIVFRYWDPVARSARTTEAAAQRVEPIRRDAAAIRDRLRTEIHDDLALKRTGVLVLAALPVLVLLIIALFAARAALPRRTDLDLWRAARRNDSGLEFYAVVQRWARRTVGDRPVFSEKQIAVLGSDALGEVQGMHRELFGRNSGPHHRPGLAKQLIGRAMALRLTGFRETLIARISRMLFGQ